MEVFRQHCRKRLAAQVVADDFGRQRGFGVAEWLHATGKAIQRFDGTMGCLRSR
jgi:hypothetical protein